MGGIVPEDRIPIEFNKGGREPTFKANPDETPDGVENSIRR